MFYYLLFLFIGVPILELFLLFSIGGAIGALKTFAVIVVTGVIGAYLAKEQGLRTLEKIKQSLSQGNIPAKEVIDGLIILVAGAVLLTPGFLTDLTGFLLLLPFGRDLLKIWLLNRFTEFIKSGKVNATVSGHVHFNSTNDSVNKDIDNSNVIDVESKQID